MKNGLELKKIIWALSVFSFIPSLLGQAAGEKYTLDDWMTVTQVRSFVWSLNGDSFYFTSDAGDSGTREIFKIPSQGGKAEQISSNPEGVRPEPKDGLVISPDGQHLFYTSTRYFQNIVDIFRLPSTGGQPTQVTFNGAIIEAGPNLSPDGRTLAFFSRRPTGTKIYLLDLDNPRAWPRLLDPGPQTERDPVWSPDGEKIAFFRDGDTWVFDRRTVESKPLTAEEYRGGNGSPVWSPDSSRVAFVNSRSGFAQIGVAEVSTGQVTPLSHSQHEHGDLAWSPDGDWLAFIRSEGMSRQVLLQPSDGAGSPKVLTEGKGIRRTPKFSPDGRWIAFLETTPDRTSDLWKVQVSGGTPEQITRSMGRIRSEDLSIPEEIYYPGPDNLQISALLYKPKDFDPNCKYPVIVKIHGHPGQWNHSMDMMWQYLVQRGFVLIAINPRGSVGFGQAFHDLHVGDYGGTEYEDCMAVLDFLKTLPYVDMSRKATWGGSGGGFMSLVIATKSPRAFQAQVIRAPVTSWRWLALERYVSPARFSTQTREPSRARSEFGGAYTDIPDRYDERSPLNFVENVMTPQLLWTGLRDSSVPPNESKRWVARMRELGKGDLIEYVEFPDEDHSLVRYRKTIRERLVRMEAFLRKHLDLSNGCATANDEVRSSN